VVKAAWCERNRSGGAQIVSRRLAGSSIWDEVERELLPFIEGAQAGALDSTDMNEDVLAAVIRLNETESLLNVEPLYSSRAHGDILSHVDIGTRTFATLSRLVDFGELSETCTPIIAGEAAQSFGQVSIVPAYMDLERALVKLTVGLFVAATHLRMSGWPWFAGIPDAWAPHQHSLCQLTWREIQGRSDEHVFRRSEQQGDETPFAMTLAEKRLAILKGGPYIGEIIGILLRRRWLRDRSRSRQR
jgi:hypothetical protein